MGRDVGARGGHPVIALLKVLTWRFTLAPPAPAWRHVAYLLLSGRGWSLERSSTRAPCRAERPRFRDSAGYHTLTVLFLFSAAVYCFAALQ